MSILPAVLLAAVLHAEESVLVAVPVVVNGRAGVAFFELGVGRYGDRGGRKSGLLLTGEQSMNLLADPLVADDNKRAIEKEMAEAGIESFPVLLEHRADPRPAWNGQSVGAVAERIMYRIITAPPDPDAEPHPRPKHRRTVVIGDWLKWWGAQSGKTLDDIHRDMRRHLDRYWAQGERPQVLFPLEPPAPDAEPFRRAADQK